MSVVAQYAPDGSRQAWYTQSLARIDEVLSVVIGQGKFWYQTDALGSTYALANGAGQVVARGGYDVFGEPVPVSGNVAQPFGFTGREHERDSGLVYARARYLQPGVGRWTASDPLSAVLMLEPSQDIRRLTDAVSQYLYAQSRPSLLRDPLGLSSTGLIWEGFMTATEMLLQAMFEEGLLAAMVEYLRFRFVNGFAHQECPACLSAERTAFGIALGPEGAHSLLRYRLPNYLKFIGEGTNDAVHYAALYEQQLALRTAAGAMAATCVSFGFQRMAQVYTVVSYLQMALPVVWRV